MGCSEHISMSMAISGLLRALRPCTLAAVGLSCATLTDWPLAVPLCLLQGGTQQCRLVHMHPCTPYLEPHATTVMLAELKLGPHTAAAQSLGAKKAAALTFDPKLTPEDREYLHSLPFTLTLPSHGVVVVHAGFVPGVPVQQQSLEHMIEVGRGSSTLPCQGCLCSSNH